jgi:hypothetical protein
MTGGLGSAAAPISSTRANDVIRRVSSILAKCSIAADGSLRKRSAIQPGMK